MKKIFPVLTLLFIQSLSLFAQDGNFTEWYLRRGDVDVYVKEIKGGKDTVIVVHGGFGANHDYMTDAIKGLEDRFHFILYDQRGSLLSPTATTNLSFRKNVDDLYALVKALESKKVKLFCHSMGTLVGMEFTSQHPELVSHLVLAGIIPPKSDSSGNIFTQRYAEQVNYLMNRKEVVDLLQPYKEKGIDSLWQPVNDDSPYSHKDVTEHWRILFASANIYDVGKHHLMKGGMGYYKKDASVMSGTVDWKYDYRPVMNDKVKTTIINGDYDFLDFNAETLKEQLVNYKNIELLVIPNAGHNSWIDDPVLFQKYFIKGLTR